MRILSERPYTVSLFFFGGVMDSKVFMVLIIILAIVLIATIVCLTMWLLKKKRSKVLEEALEDEGFFKNRDALMQKMFVVPDITRGVVYQGKNAQDFTAASIKYLVNYFGFTINDDTPDDLASLYKLIKREEVLAKKYKIDTDDYIPEYTMYYCKSALSETWKSFSFTSHNIAKLHKQVKAIIAKRNVSKVSMPQQQIPSELKNAVFRRDNWTCQVCGNSMYNEKNLLLDVKYIIPPSQGGQVEVNNLQTICWRCSKPKYSKVVSMQKFPEEFVSKVAHIE